MTEFAQMRWQQAKKSLSSAGKIVDDDPDSATSRAYYAAFHALTALFALRDQSFSKHTEIRAALHRDLIRGGVLLPQTGEDYDFLMDMREAGDYGRTSTVSLENARMAIDRAAAFLAAVAQACPELSVG